jgi:glucose/arabinose dehydrogenase
VIDRGGASPRKVLEGLHTPLGLLWNGEALYVSHAGGVTAYSEFDGTTFAKEKTVLELSDAAGEPNGLALSPDGRIVLGISAPCDHCAPTDRYSGSVVSFLPDGSDIHVMASGIRAPIGLAYVPGTDDLLVTMNQRDDLGDATPGDWLGLVKHGQDWGFPDCYGQGGTACTGVPEPAAVLDRHAAVSGLAILEGADDASSTAAFTAEWALGKVVRVDLAADATTGTASTFVTGLKNPVPVIAGANGDVLVGDWTTGTIYLISGVRG